MQNFERQALLDAVVSGVDFEEFQVVLSWKVTVTVFHFPGSQLVINHEHLRENGDVRIRIKHLVEAAPSVHRIIIGVVNDHEKSIYWLQFAVGFVNWVSIVENRWIIDSVQVTAKKT